MLKRYKGSSLDHGTKTLKEKSRSNLRKRRFPRDRARLAHAPQPLSPGESVSIYASLRDRLGLARGNKWVPSVGRAWEAGLAILGGLSWYVHNADL